MTYSSYSSFLFLFLIHHPRAVNVVVSLFSRAVHVRILLFALAFCSPHILLHIVLGQPRLCLFNLSIAFFAD